MINFYLVIGIRTLLQLMMFAPFFKIRLKQASFVICFLFIDCRDWLSLLRINQLSSLEPSLLAETFGANSFLVRNWFSLKTWNRYFFRFQYSWSNLQLFFKVKICTKRLKLFVKFTDDSLKRGVGGVCPPWVARRIDGIIIQQRTSGAVNH